MTRSFNPDRSITHYQKTSPWLQYSTIRHDTTDGNWLLTTLTHCSRHFNNTRIFQWPCGKSCWPNISIHMSLSILQENKQLDCEKSTSTPHIKRNRLCKDCKIFILNPTHAKSHLNSLDGCILLIGVGVLLYLSLLPFSPPSIFLLYLFLSFYSSSPYRAHPLTITRNRRLKTAYILSYCKEKKKTRVWM